MLPRLSRKGTFCISGSPIPVLDGNDSVFFAANLNDGSLLRTLSCSCGLDSCFLALELGLADLFGGADARVTLRLVSKELWHWIFMRAQLLQGLPEPRHRTLRFLHVRQPGLDDR